MQNRIVLALGLLFGLSSFAQSKVFEVDLRFFSPCSSEEITIVEGLCEQYALDISWAETFQAAKLSSNMAFSPSELILECLDQGIIVAAIASTFNYFKSGDMEKHKQTTLIEVKKRFSEQHAERYKKTLKSQERILTEAIEAGIDRASTRAVLEQIRADK